MISRETLKKARLFLAQAEQAAASEDRFKTTANLEAAIVFGRSVTFHIQSEYTHQPEFKAWYAPHKDAMNNDLIMQFMNDNRVDIIHIKPVKVGRHVSLKSSIRGLSMTGDAKLTVVRAEPWYRRSPKIIWEDIRVKVIPPIQRPIQRWRQRRELARKRVEVLRRARGVVTDDNYYFADAAWRDRPAFELVSEYLDKLEVIVNEAEARFGEGH